MVLGKVEASAFPLVAVVLIVVVAVLMMTFVAVVLIVVAAVELIVVAVALVFAVAVVQSAPASFGFPLTAYIRWY